jgi:hypothetical protein
MPLAPLAQFDGWRGWLFLAETLGGLLNVRV